MLNFVGSMQVAYVVLQAVRQMTCNRGDLKKKLENSYVEAFTNCREQGFSITNGDKKVSFSEHRSTDYIIVYHGDMVNFCHIHNVPKNKLWKNPEFFNPGDYDKAAEFIINHLTGE